MASRPTEDFKVTGGVASVFNSTVNQVRAQGEVDASANADLNRAMKNYQMEDPPGKNAVPATP